MCSIEMFGLGLSATSTVMGAYGQYQSAKAQQQAHQYNAQVGEAQAQDALMRGRRDAARLQSEGERFKGSQKVALAASGVDVGYGSALDILTGTDVMIEADAELTRYNAEREAWGYRTGADMDRFSAGSIRPGLAATGSLLTGASNVADRWYTYKSAGLLS